MSGFLRSGASARHGMAVRASTTMTAVWALAAAALSALSPVESARGQPGTEQDAAAGRQRIERLADLPRFSYEISVKPSDLLTAPDFVSDYGPRLRADTQALLDAYDIADRSLLRELRTTLVRLDLLDGNYASALAGIESLRLLHDKPGDRLAAGLVEEMIARAHLAGTPDVGAAVRATAAPTLAALPYETVRDVVKEAKGRVELSTPGLFVGRAQGSMDAGAMTLGALSREVLAELLELRWALDQVLPSKGPLVTALQTYITANEIAKPDIWAARSVDLAGRENLSEIVIAVWDSGVDVELFPDHMWRNSAEREDGVDNDANGYVDDLYGIAHEWSGTRTSGLLLPLGEAAAREAALRNDMKGALDTNASVDSEEARAFKAKLGAMEPAAAQALIEDIQLYGNYMHGTHVAGIVLAGNPAARLLSSRLTFPHQLKMAPYDERQADAHAEQFAETIAYFKTHGVRVVNMSWGFNPAIIERSLEMNGLEPDPDARWQRALAIYARVAEPFAQAIAAAPDILFVAAAGNSDQDVEFSQFMPSGFELPNAVAVGAVDQAGDETSFTSYGKTVLLHANGFEVESYVPGGSRLKGSGTSMASPNVANLAAKILAIDPSLRPPEVIALMREHAETTADGRRFLIDPKATIEALGRRMNQAAKP